MTTRATLFALLAASLVASTVAVGGVTAPTSLTSIVRAAVVQPHLDAFEQLAMFSRARLVPPELTLTLADAPARDARGATFHTFEVARPDTTPLTGCVYADGQVFVAHTGPDGTAGLVTAATHPELLGASLLEAVTAPPTPVVAPAGTCAPNNRSS
ncbi:MAG: hypothetical protein ACI8PZ_004728 [Myxococcota bacterium]|jgi:hypothetical protein